MSSKRERCPHCDTPIDIEQCQSCGESSSCYKCDPMTTYNGDPICLSCARHIEDSESSS